MKHIFLAYLAYNKRVQKLTIFYQHHWLTPSEKFQIFNFFKLLFLWPTKMFFHSRISWNTFSWPMLPKIKKMEKLPIFDQNHGLTPLEKIQVFDLLNFLFLSSSKSVFSFWNIVKHIFLRFCLLPKPWTNLFWKIENFRLLELLVF